METKLNTMERLIQIAEAYLELSRETFTGEPGNSDAIEFTRETIEDAKRESAAAPALLEALQRIANSELRPSRRGRGLLPIDQAEALQRTARAAIAQAVQP